MVCGDRVADCGGDFGGIFFLWERLTGVVVEAETDCLVDVPLCWADLADNLLEVLTVGLPEDWGRLPFI